MKKADVVELFTIFRENNPEPQTELQYNSVFELLVSVVLSAQATDVSVNKATEKLYPIANTPTAILTMGESGLKDYIKTIGLYNTKARNVIKLCQALVDKHNSEVPDNRKDLEALAGVGRKTANVVLNTAFGQMTMAVDTHIFRVGNRLGLALGKNVVEVEKKLLKAIPDEFMLDAHHWLILHGRYTCLARKPKCMECAVEHLCSFKDKIVG
jgi:endonuclease-3